MIRPFLVHITGNPNITTLAKINVRAKPGTSPGIAVLFEAAIPTPSLPILEVMPDQDNNALNGKVYQWFRVQFPNGSTGWVRDDLVSVEGDGSRYGYPYLVQATYAMSLLRQLLPFVPPVTAPTPPLPPIFDPAPTPSPTPVTPAPAPTPPPVTPPVTPAPIPAPTPPGDVFGMAISVSGLNLRAAPVNGSIKARLPYKARVKLLQVQPQGGTSNYKWAQVESDQGIGWVRTDYLSISSDAARFGLSKGDEYPPPLQNYWWVRGQNEHQNPGESDHLGWDFGASTGEIVRGGPNGGLVVRLFKCTRCTTMQPNVLSQGIPLDSPSVFLDEAWGFGYGNAVMVRYLNSQLPGSTQDRLTAQRLGGAHLYVVYAHLTGYVVSARQELGPFAQIGVIGNTGNSSALHLHVEVRASMNPDDTNWAAMRPRELDPEILFRR